MTLLLGWATYPMYMFSMKMSFVSKNMNHRFNLKVYSNFSLNDFLWSPLREAKSEISLEMSPLLNQHIPSEIISRIFMLNAQDKKQPHWFIFSRFCYSCYHWFVHYLLSKVKPTHPTIKNIQFMHWALNTKFLPARTSVCFSHTELNFGIISTTMVMYLTKLCYNNNKDSEMTMYFTRKMRASRYRKNINFCS